MTLCFTLNRAIVVSFDHKIKIFYDYDRVYQIEESKYI